MHLHQASKLAGHVDSVACCACSSSNTLASGGEVRACLVTAGGHLADVTRTSGSVGRGRGGGGANAVKSLQAPADDDNQDEQCRLHDMHVIASDMVRPHAPQGQAVGGRQVTAEPPVQMMCPPSTAVH